MSVWGLVLGGLALLGTWLEVRRRRRAWWGGPYLVEQLARWAAQEPVMPALHLPPRQPLKVTRLRRRRDRTRVVRARFGRKG